MLHFEQAGNGIALFEADSFSISQILECGQCFRFEKTEKGYKIIAMGRVLYIEETESKIMFYPCSVAEFEDIWINYFDLDTNYTIIKEVLASNDPVMRDAVEYGSGIRLLNQDKWECLISFIISQNNNIPRIKKIINLISQTYGTEISEGCYDFPTANELISADIASLMACNTGFRAKYIMDAVEKVTTGQVDINELSLLETAVLKESLMSIKGIGNKVSDCILLFSFGRRDIFPVDVWVKRVMSHFYFKGEDVSIPEIHKKAEKLFGEYGGYAQQYLFYYARQFYFK